MRTILLLLALASCAPAPAQTLKTGDKAPDFTLTDQNGKPWTLSDYIGKKVLVIYFYPKDESPVCTKEACAFRDSYTAFTQKGALVVGINGGSVDSHHSFQQNHQLPFILLSDPGNKVLREFGVRGSFGVTGRETFVVDLGGKIVYAYSAMLKGSRHEEEALAHIPGNP